MSSPRRLDSLLRRKQTGVALVMWFEVAVVSTIFAVGNILFGHFEEGAPKWRRLVKMALVMLIAVFISKHLGRNWFWAFLGAMTLPAVYIHAWWLPSHGINGWTGEPKEKYCELRGWRTRGPAGCEGAAEQADAADDARPPSRSASEPRG